jgi:hypothetical protein
MMDLYSKDDEDKTDDSGYSDDDESDECAEALKDCWHLCSEGDFKAAADAFRQAVKCANESGADDDSGMEKSSKGHGVLIALGAPKKG